MPRLRILRSASTTSLLVRAQKDPTQYAAFYDAYADRVLAFLVRRVFDPEVAVDLMSETFAKVLARRMQFRGDTAAEEQGWLFAIARTELWHYWRSGRVERAALERFAISVPPLDDDEFVRVEALAGLDSLDGPLLEAVRGLPEDQRRAVDLRVIQERSYAELAATLEVSQQVARARVSRGLRALARALRDDLEMEDVA
ncbi:RNA polymerase sigma factor [Solirubrobacter phytolaccae]|uniref:RNA polymerase sigma factor n=1 Tax=Solirubrobacter phytolaccae TaxID=1404360 RepID=A0A9X3SAW0_9ACTN|nr:RNA polymerase sigma factor [Solirubrobacter phytolaccae]MDA0182946.1 RNA polymerase sigma factor [Solirubrobacter phytolaccae]